MKPVLPQSSSGSGFWEWMLQRVSAIYLAIFFVGLVVYLALNPIANQSAWRAFVATGFVKLSFALFFISLLVHAWTGMRSVYLDYLHPLWLRLTATWATALLLLALAVWSAGILLTVSA
jgi:succinate dehydrogenase / fumarate reductase membrane anchor subunit